MGKIGKIQGRKFRENEFFLAGDAYRRLAEDVGYNISKTRGKLWQTFRENCDGVKNVCSPIALTMGKFQNRFPKRIEFSWVGNLN